MDGHNIFSLRQDDVQPTNCPASSVSICQRSSNLTNAPYATIHGYGPCDAATGTTAGASMPNQAASGESETTKCGASRGARGWPGAVSPAFTSAISCR